MKKSILVVDDNNVSRMMLRGILEDEYEILEAENGWTAMNVLSHGKDSIVAVLLDIIMPVMDGYEFLTKVKQDKTICDIPVFALTQLEDMPSQIKVLTLGALDILPKPYQSDILKLKLKNITQMVENIKENK